MELLKEIAGNIQDGDAEKVSEFTKQAIARNLPPKKILDDGLLAGMNIIGNRFKEHEIFLPDVLLAAKALYAGLDMLKPLLARDGVPTIGKVVLGSVQGDLHDIGKNLVGIMLKGAGFDVIDIGNDVAPEKFVETAKSENADLIGMSALLTTTMPVMKRVVELLKEQKLSGKIRTIIGGAPVSGEFACEIGADRYAYDAASAVERVKDLVRSG